jgi:hypothetical protein
MKKVVMIAGILAGVVPLAIVADAVDIPDDLKGVVPVYPGAKAVLAMKVENGSQVHFEADVKPKAVLEFYKKKMGEKGWKVEMEMALPTGTTLMMKKGEKALNIMAMGGKEENTRIVITLGSEN